MTTEIEKTFFDTFGIEPKLKTFAIKRDEQGELTYPPIYEYPQITDRILLELICICCKAFNLLNIELSVVFAFNIDEIKQSILNRLIWLDEVYHNKDIKEIAITGLEGFCPKCSRKECEDNNCIETAIRDILQKISECEGNNEKV